MNEIDEIIYFDNTFHLEYHKKIFLYKKCKNPQCEKKRKRKGHCDQCYFRLMRNGNYFLKRKIFCLVCGDKAKAKMLCHKHYQRARKYNSPYIPKTCKVWLCKNMQVERKNGEKSKFGRFCRYHFNQRRYREKKLKRKAAFDFLYQLILTESKKIRQVSKRGENI